MGIPDLSMKSVAERMNDRRKFLQKLYDLTDGSETKFYDMWEVGEQADLDKGLTESIVHYLIADGLVRMRALGGLVSITHIGIKSVEAESQTNIPRNTNMSDEGHTSSSQNYLAFSKLRSIISEFQFRAQQIFDEMEISKDTIESLR